MLQKYVKIFFTFFCKIVAGGIVHGSLMVFTICLSGVHGFKTNPKSLCAAAHVGLASISRRSAATVRCMCNRNIPLVVVALRRNGKLQSLAQVLSGVPEVQHI